MKKVLATTVLLSALTVTCFASPLTDYTTGKASIDLSIRPSIDIKGTDSEGSAKWDSKSTNLDFGVTVGLGNNFAFQYKQSNADTKTYVYEDIGSGHGDFSAQEFNVLYKVSKTASAFIGATKATNDIKANLGTLTGKDSNGFQVGVVDSVKVADKTTAYGVVAVGDKLNSFEIGIGHELADNLELNLFYKQAKYKDLEFNQVSDYKYDYKLSGIGYGVTYKF